jgi:hypothetical protein
MIIKAMEVLGRRLGRFGFSSQLDKPRAEIVGAMPHTFGWLRRSEFDDLPGDWYFEAWERPDGEIVKIPRCDAQPVTTIIAVRERGAPAVVVWPRGGCRYDRSERNHYDRSERNHGDLPQGIHVGQDA